MTKVEPSPKTETISALVAKVTRKLPKNLLAIYVLVYSFHQHS